MTFTAVGCSHREMESVLKPKDEELPLDLEDFRRQLKLHGNLYDVAIRLGLHPRHFYEVFARRKPLTLEVYFRTVRVLQLSLPAGIKTLDQQVSDKPVEILLAHREGRKLATNGFLSRMATRITAILRCDVAKRHNGPSVAANLAELEELRNSDRLEAQKAAQELAYEELRKLEDQKGPKSSSDMGGLAAILALWAAIQRSRGFRDLALKAYTLAFPLARRSGNHWALGCCYKRAAYLLQDLGCPDLGFNFITEAIGHFGASCSQLDIGKCLVDRGYMLSSAGRYVESHAAYETALLHLPGSEWRYRVGAFQGCGRNSFKQSKAQEARSYLNSAANECREVDLYLGQIKWTMANVEAELGQHTNALRLFHEATELLAKFGSAADVALVCLDHAELHLKLKNDEACAQIALGVARWLPKLRANPILCRAFDKFVDLARVARARLADVEKARSEIREAWKKLGEQGLPS
jgi:tetratricopeptide (TPR) repeat protein